MLKDALNIELSKVLGVEHDWMDVISKTVQWQAMKLSNSGLLDDVVTDVSGDIIIQAKTGKLSIAVIRAKEQATNDTELLRNLVGTVKSATRFRTRDAMKLRYDRTVKGSQFSQIEQNGEAGDFAEYVEARPESSGLELDEYTDLLVNELEVMATAAEWQSNNKLAKRLRLTKLVVVDRVQGMKLKDLMTKHGVRGKATMQAIINDINIAFGNVARELNDPVLLEGLAQAA